MFFLIKIIFLKNLKKIIEVIKKRYNKYDLKKYSHKKINSEDF